MLNYVSRICIIGTINDTMATVRQLLFMFISWDIYSQIMNNAVLTIGNFDNYSSNSIGSDLSSKYFAYITNLGINGHPNKQ